MLTKEVRASDGGKAETVVERHVDLSNAHKDVLKSLYEHALRTVDDLPYTPEFDSMHSSFIEKTGREITKHDFWRAISGLRKAGQLRRKER